jgi:adenosylcobinamide-GDP ribazoletransferase
VKGFHALAIALQFLTRVPVSSRVEFRAEAQGWSVAWYPLVGLLMGGALLLLRMLLADAGPLLASALVLTVWVLITGGMHLDGLADCADAWVGGQGDRERSLRIMKDPCSGPIAVSAVVLLLLLKFSALAELSGLPGMMPLLWSPVIGRSLAPLLLLTTPYVRPNGLGSPLAKNLPRLPVGLATGFSLLCALAWLGPWPLLATVLAFSWLRNQMVEKLGGCTGDTLGASIEIVEALVLVVCALVDVGEGSGTGHIPLAV